MHACSCIVIHIANNSIYIDIHTIAAIKADESYKNLSTSFKNVFDDINYYIEHPHIRIDEVDYTLEFYLTADYKVARDLIK